MFISKAEKEHIFSLIDSLQKQVKELTGLVLSARSQEPAPKKRHMSQAHKDKLSAMMKKRHADAKAQKENT